MYHPDRFKTRYCINYDNPEQCAYGPFCSFVHEESEFRIPLLHKMTLSNKFFIFDYKTVMCPFNKTHSRLHCVYAHNQQDFRRKLVRNNRLAYKASDCRQWKKF